MRLKPYTESLVLRFGSAKEKYSESAICLHTSVYKRRIPKKEAVVMIAVVADVEEISVDARHSKKNALPLPGF
jgi:hypothetical protein